MFWLMFPKWDAKEESREDKLLDIEQRMDAFLQSRSSHSDDTVSKAVRSQREAVRAERAGQEQWH